MTWYPLMEAFLHYECWLEMGRENLVVCMTPRRVPDIPVPSPVSTPDQLTLTFDDLYREQERRRALQARCETWNF